MPGRTFESFLTIGTLLAALTASGADALTRAQLDGLLKEAAKDPPKGTRLSPGATCYAMMPPSLERKEYLCPVCGSRTFLAIENYDWRKLETYRQQAEKLRAMGLEISLDESCLCARCAEESGAAKAPRFAFWRKADGSTRIVKAPSDWMQDKNVDKDRPVAIRPCDAA